MAATWTRITTSAVVSKVPCYLGSVVFTPNGDSNNGNVTLYNGESTADPSITTLRSGTGQSMAVPFTPPLFCPRGLYVVLGSHVDECLIQYEPLKS